MWMEIAGYFTLIIYTMALVYITIYCLLQFHLLLHYTKARTGKNPQAEPSQQEPEYFPMVTIQLPLYNEVFVVERLIDNIIEMDYPREALEIQVLDDSTDDTLEVSKRKVAEYREKGFNIYLIHRKDRSGYKAGALKNGMKTAKGDYIAIFDADFLPRKDFLNETLHHFKNQEVAVVQTRWSHINQDFSLLTEVQALQLNVHFTVEQQGRESANYFLQFNGTAGIWRKDAIEDAGGWEADTLTEDLDLSYRAQLRGWKIIYLEDITAPAELPSEINGLKSQQYRWMKGGAETAKKLLPRVWASDLRLIQKVHATTHLLGSTVFLFVFLLGVFSVPLLFFINPLGIELSFMSFFLISLLAISIVYYIANVNSAWEYTNKLKAVFKFIILFPVFLALSMGLSLHNSIAVLHGYLGRPSAFVRTPKFNITSSKTIVPFRQYVMRSLPVTTIFEGCLALYFLFGIILGIHTQNTALILFHIMLFFGYGCIFYFSIRQLNLKTGRQL